MADHEVYRAIVSAVRDKRLTEPFGQTEFRTACPGFAEGTYRNFLRKHRRGNGATSELFEVVGTRKYRLIRPLLYELSDRR
jgi:hypothetical protein